MNQRPLKDLSESELIDLWKLTNEMNDLGQKDMCELLKGRDICNLRISMMVQVKLCQKYGIPYPELKSDCFDVDGEVRDSEGDYDYDDLLEYQIAGLHRYLTDFSCIDGIGDFDVSYLQDPVMLIEKLEKAGIEASSDEYAKAGFIKEALDNAADGESEDDEEDDKEDDNVLDYYVEEFEIPAYGEMVGIAMNNGGTDYWSFDEIKVTSSKKVQQLLSFLENNETCCENRQVLLDMLKQYLSCVLCNTYFWIPLNTSEWVDKEGRWCALSTIMNYAEDSNVDCDLHRFTNLRVGAYIVMELAERYVSAAA